MHPGDAAVFIDIAASHHMVPAESQLCQHVVNKIDCSVRVKGSYGLSNASSKGALRFHLRNDRGKLVPIDLEVQIVPNLGASVFSAGALILSNPPVLPDGNDVFPIVTGVSRMFVLLILLDGQEEPHHISHTTVDTDTWHRRMDLYHPRASKQPAEEHTARVNDIDSSGAGTPSAIGYKRDYSRTYNTVGLGTAKFVADTGIDPNVISQEHLCRHRN